MNIATWDQIWCYYCNLVHAIYREIRHIGDKNDSEAKCHVSQKYLTAARMCQKNRKILKSTVPFKNVNSKITDDVIDCYRTLTGLAPSDLVDIFRSQSWVTSYGGEKWAVIAEVLMQLKKEIDHQELEAAQETISRVKGLRHNSGALVPSVNDWKRNKWLQEKWPGLCEQDE